MPIYTAVVQNAQGRWSAPRPQRRQVLSVEIKPSYRCNQNCVMCPYDK